MAPRKDNTRDERGVAIMYVAVFLVSSLWLVSLAIDMGKLMATKTELQRAADAAAAGARCRCGGRQHRAPGEIGIGHH